MEFGVSLNEGLDCILFIPGLDFFDLSAHFPEKGGGEIASEEERDLNLNNDVLLLFRSLFERISFFAGDDCVYKETNSSN